MPPLTLAAGPDSIYRLAPGAHIRHQASVSLYYHQRSLYTAASHYVSYGVHELADHGNQLGVEIHRYCSFVKAQGRGKIVSAGYRYSQSLVHYLLYIYLMGRISHAGIAGDSYGINTSSVGLNCFSHLFHIQIFFKPSLNVIFSFNDRNLSGNHLPSGSSAYENQPYLAASSLYNGVCGQSSRKTYHGYIPEHFPGYAVKALGNTLLQIVFCGKSLVCNQDIPGVGVNNHYVGICSAGVYSYYFLHYLITLIISSVFSRVSSMSAMV